MLPQKRQYQGNDLLFAARCRQRIAAGESAVTDALLPLRALDGKRDVDALFQTLAVYLLDENGSVPATAERLYLHKNTVKYRLRVMSDCFGFALARCQPPRRCMKPWPSAGCSARGKTARLTATRRHMRLLRLVCHLNRFHLLPNWRHIRSMTRTLFLFNWTKREPLVFLSRQRRYPGFSIQFRQPRVPQSVGTWRFERRTACGRETQCR